MSLTFAPLLAVGLLLAADDKEAVKKDLDRLQGSWTCTKLTYNGGDFPAKLRLVVKGDAVTIEADDELKKEYGKFTMKLEPGFTPKLIDITITIGTQKDQLIEGIYEVKDDEFKLCVKSPGKDRPPEFTSTGGSSHALVVFKRDKP